MSTLYRYKTEYRTISKDKTHGKLEKTSENNNIKTTKNVSKVTFVSEPESCGECTMYSSTHYTYAAKQYPARTEHMHSTATCACMHAETKRTCTVSAVTRMQLLAHTEKTGINSAQHTNYDTSQKLNSRTTKPQSCIQQTNITYNYSNRPETNIAESVWAFFTDPQHHSHTYQKVTFMQAQSAEARLLSVHQHPFL